MLCFTLLDYKRYTKLYCYFYGSIARAGERCPDHLAVGFKPVNLKVRKHTTKTVQEPLQKVAAPEGPSTSYMVQR